MGLWGKRRLQPRSACAQCVGDVRTRARWTASMRCATTALTFRHLTPHTTRPRRNLPHLRLPLLRQRSLLQFLRHPLVERERNPAVWRPGSWGRYVASPLLSTHARLTLAGFLSLSLKHINTAQAARQLFWARVASSAFFFTFARRPFQYPGSNRKSRQAVQKCTF
jgi:hypothetical protein